MPQSPIAKHIDDIIRASLAPELKKRGFRKKARNFRLTEYRATQLVNVQASMWSDNPGGANPARCL